MRWILLALSAALAASCSYVALDHPDAHEHQALDQAALGFATERAMQKLPLSVPRLHGEPIYVEVFGSDPGRLRAHVFGALRSYRLTIVDDPAEAKYTLRVSERLGGVNGLTEVYWYSVLAWTWYASALSAQGECALDFELIDQDGALQDSGSSGLQTVQVDLERNKTLWLLFFPLPVKRYVANGEGYEASIPLSLGLPVLMQRPLF